MSESFQGCCSSLTTTFNIKYCAVCYVHLVQMEQCLLRWKSRMQYQNTFKCNNVSRIFFFFFVVGTEITAILPLSLPWLLELVVSEYFNSGLHLIVLSIKKMPLMSRGAFLSSRTVVLPHVSYIISSKITPFIT